MRIAAMRTYTAATFLVAIAMGIAPVLDFSGNGRFGAVAAGGKAGSSGNSAAGGVRAGVSAGAKAGPNSGPGSKTGGKSHGKSTGSGVGGGKIGKSPGSSAGGGAKAGAIAGSRSWANGKPVHRMGGKPLGSGGGIATPKGKGAPPSGALRGLTVGPGSPKRSGVPKTVRAGAVAGIAPATGVQSSVRLPSALWPLKGLGERGEYQQGALGYAVTDPTTTGAISDGSGAVVRVCLQAITSAALPLGAVRVRAASAGPPVPKRDGGLTAPIAVRIEYEGRGAIEVRQARVRCHLDANGMVVAMT
ncbi:hypothetical transmembrane protein [Sinorhizobium fredii HH103]|uniref:Hypothetical transmembrane protein n=1 Tax=Sinorhizobium fredii (strain HH103) TaxID=1117943 RepID=G9A5X4_SINF1|nr:hypothetical transmembrane protein [Sinorhizobium fredii HH103]